MFSEESLWIKSAWNKLSPADIESVGNLGSSSFEFRSKIQPHIQQNIIQPLENRGAKIVNIDLKPLPGVDVIGDITSTEFGKTFENQFSLLICTNLLEHVTDIGTVVDNLVRASRNNGCVLITVPYKYKIHLDPIDNGFRPTPKEIEVLFSGVEHNVIASEIITIRSLREYKIKKSRLPIWGYRSRIKYFLGLKYKVSGILLRLHKA